MNQSLAGIEEELTRTERKLATLRDSLRRSHHESAADAAALRQMGDRVKEILSRPKSWSGGAKRSDAAELERLRADMRTRSEANNRSVEAMKALSAEATALSRRAQDLSKVRAELVARGETAPQPPASPISSVIRQAPQKAVVQEAPRTGPGPSMPEPLTRRRRPLT